MTTSTSTSATSTPEASAAPPAANSTEDILARLGREEIGEHEMHVLFAGGLTARRDAAAPGTTFPADRYVVLRPNLVDAAGKHVPDNVGKMITQRGYIPSVTTDWTAAQFITIGADKFTWKAATGWEPVP